MWDLQVLPCQKYQRHVRQHKYNNCMTPIPPWKTPVSVALASLWHWQNPGYSMARGWNLQLMFINGCLWNFVSLFRQSTWYARPLSAWRTGIGVYENQRKARRLWREGKVWLRIVDEGSCCRPCKESSSRHWCSVHSTGMHSDRLRDAKCEGSRVAWYLAKSSPGRTRSIPCGVNSCEPFSTNVSHLHD